MTSRTLVEVRLTTNMDGAATEFNQIVMLRENRIRLCGIGIDYGNVFNWQGIVNARWPWLTVELPPESLTYRDEDFTPLLTGRQSV